MKDKLYTSDIPSDYHYVSFSNDYFEVYNRPSAYNTTLHYYRFYYKYSPGVYVEGDRTFSSYNTTYFEDYPTSSKVWDRPDLPNILTATLIIALFGLFLINLVTSIVKKGGILGGLL